jgi:hypothetical protein
MCVGEKRERGGREGGREGGMDGCREGGRERERERKREREREREKGEGGSFRPHQESKEVWSSPLSCLISKLPFFVNCKFKRS